MTLGSHKPIFHCTVNRWLFQEYWHPGSVTQPWPSQAALQTFYSKPRRKEPLPYFQYFLGYYNTAHGSRQCRHTLSFKENMKFDLREGRKASGVILLFWCCASNITSDLLCRSRRDTPGPLCPAHPAQPKYSSPEVQDFFQQGCDFSVISSWT